MKKIKKLEKTKKGTDAALRYAEGIIATLREPFLVLDRNLRIVSANQPFYTTFKTAEKETIGRLLPDLGNKAWNIPKLLRLLKEILPNKIKIENYEVEHSFKHIGPRIMNLNARKLRVSKEIAREVTAGQEEEEEEEEEEELILLAIEDITEQRKAQTKLKKFSENLEELVKEKTEQIIRLEKLATIGKLAAIINHELRNILGLIRNSVYFLKIRLKKSIAEDDKIKKHLNILQTEINNADKIISGILGFAMTKPPSFTEIEINSLVEQALDRADIPRKVKIKINLGANLPKIKADAAQIKQIFSNIINNAVEAMQEGGELKVTTKQNDQFIAIAFKDSGAGISEKNLKKIFGPLFTTKPGGIGLGLANCQAIINSHKGKIEVESRPGKGAVFTIKLPLVHFVKRSSQLKKSNNKNMSKKILLIEDRENTRTVLTDVLENEGYEVVQASSGKEGLDKIEKEKPGLVLMDVSMPPGINGYEVCQQIKKVKKLPVKVIIYTATYENIDAVKARRFGADDFIIKGEDPDILLKAVKKLL